MFFDRRNTAQVHQLTGALYRTAASLLKAASVMALTLTAATSIAQTAGSYSLSNIISDGYVPATATDPGFVDPWGISIGKDFWIDTAVTGFSYVNFANGAISFKATIPSTSGTVTGQPTGTVLNTTTGFALSDVSPASFLFASLDGGIWGWNGGLFATGNVSLKAIDNSADSAVYTDITLDPSAAGTVLLAANFGKGASVEVYDQTFRPTTLAGSFTDPNVPAGYAPYAIHVIANQVFVTYMLRSTSTYSETLGPDTGFISVFDVNGNFIKRAITGGNLNSPWGMALAPSTFGIYGGDLLVGNLGDGLINVYDPASFAYLGQLTDDTGKPILASYPGAGKSSSYVGLWELVFGTRTASSTPSSTQVGDTNTLYFAAGLDAETHGVFGAITPTASSGRAANFGFSTSTPLATVASGAATTLTLAVAPINGFSGPVNFACSGLPANATCNFSSSTLNVTPQASATETLSIETGGYVANKGAAPFGAADGKMYTAFALLPFGALVLLLNRKRFKPYQTLAVLLVGIGTVSLTLTGCGGYSSKQSGGTPVTQAGTSAVTITATSGAISQSATVNLIVQ